MNSYLLKNPKIGILYLTLAVVVSCMTPDLFGTNENYEKISRAVVRLQYRQIRSIPGESNPDTSDVAWGTGFIVSYKNRSFLITARHVAECGHDLWSRAVFTTENPDSHVVAWIEIPKESWTYHFDAGSKIQNPVDVAVCEIYGRHVRLDSLYSKFGTTTIPWSMLVNVDPEPFSQIIVAGFPLDLGFELVEQRPLLRQGLIALSSDQPWLKISGKLMDQRCVIIDCSIFGGNSGSPMFIFNQLTGESRLAGIVVASNAALDYAIVEPISRILETVEIACTDPHSAKVSAKIRPIWEF